MSEFYLVIYFFRTFISLEFANNVCQQKFAGHFINYEIFSIPLGHDL